VKIAKNSQRGAAPASLKAMAVDAAGVCVMTDEALGRREE
jgi:hypothetical protein